MRVAQSVSPVYEAAYFVATTPQKNSKRFVRLNEESYIDLVGDHLYKNFVSSNVLVCNYIITHVLLYYY